MVSSTDHGWRSASPAVEDRVWSSPNIFPAACSFIASRRDDAHTDDFPVIDLPDSDDELGSDMVSVTGLLLEEAHVDDMMDWRVGDPRLRKKKPRKEELGKSGSFQLSNSTISSSRLTAVALVVGGSRCSRGR